MAFRDWSMYGEPPYYSTVDEYLERTINGWRCKHCGREVHKNKSMGNAKGAMVAHIKGHIWRGELP